MKTSLFFLISCLLLAAVPAFAQRDTTKTVEVLPGTKHLYLKKPNPQTELQILSGDVRLRQGTTLFYCDSCVINNSANLFEAFGHVHINDSDTADAWSDHLRYLIDKKMAYLDGNVRLSDGHATLTTPTLQYDVQNKIGTYSNGGKVVNKKSVLTSKEGIYYADLRDIYFKNDVLLKDPGYFLKTDSLLYNTESQLARFIADTYIRDSSNRTIRTREGFYDLKGGKAQFTQRTTIQDKSLTVIGDHIANDDATQTIEIVGRGVLIDTAKGVNILANRIFANKKAESYLATEKPLMIVKQDKDSIYITADTLFSARLTDLIHNKDSLKKMGLKETDSANRYFEAFRHVRIFSDSVQAVSDSLYYNFKDSIFHLYKDPVVWTHNSQLTGDTIYLYTKNRKADRIKVFENSFMISEVDPGVYNQIKSTRLDGYFKEGLIDSVRARGTAESVYFVKDKDSAYSSVNQTQSDIMDVYFDQGDLYKVVLRSSVKGTLWPIKQKRPSEMKLEKFHWLEGRRPKTKYELFE
jgi:lipopolysaccharide export system protein LptA